jgi:hypothetical protein
MLGPARHPVSRARPGHVRSGPESPPALLRRFGGISTWRSHVRTGETVAGVQVHVYRQEHVEVRTPRPSFIWALMRERTRRAAERSCCVMARPAGLQLGRAPRVVLGGGGRFI